MAIKTKIALARNYTADELAKFNAKLAEATAAGTTDGSAQDLEDPPGSPTASVRVWTTIEAANDWLALLNSFNPPPVSASVVTE